MSRPIIVTVALTGGMHTKAANPNLPEQPDEIIRQAYDAYNEGAAVAHLHAREPDGSMSGDSAIYRRIHEGIRSRCPMVLQDTTGGGANLTVEQRVQAVLDAQPEMASLNMGTLVRTTAKGQYRNSIFRNTTDDIEAFAKALGERGIKPEMEVYSHAMFREVENLIEKKLIQPPYWVDIVLGMMHQGAESADVKTLLSMVDFLPAGGMFNVCATGAAELPLTTLSALVGGHVRVGLEDNIYYRKGELAKSNAQLVARSVRILRELGLEPASPDEARTILGLPKLSETGSKHA